MEKNTMLGGAEEGLQAAHKPQIPMSEFLLIPERWGVICLQWTQKLGGLFWAAGRTRVNLVTVVVLRLGKKLQCRAV